MRRSQWFLACLILSSMGPAVLGMTADDVSKETGIAGGMCSFPRFQATDQPLVLELARKPSFVVHVLSADEKALAALRAAGEAEGLLGRSLYVEKGDASVLPYADRLVDLLIISDLSDKDLTSELKKEWTRVVGPSRGAVLVGRAKEAGRGLSSRRLAAWAKDLPLARTLSDASGSWALLRIPFPEWTDTWTHRLHGADNTQVSSDRTLQAPFLTQWWGLPRQEGFWGTTVVSCDGRMFTIRGSRNAWSEVSLTARSLNNGIVLWQKRLRPAPKTERVPHGGYIPGRSCVAATDRSLLLVSSNTVVRLNAETGEDQGSVAGPNAAGQIKWMGCSGNLLAMMAGQADVVTPIAYQTVAKNPIGRDLAVYDLEKNKELWRDTVAGDIDEKLIVVRDDKLYCLVQGVGMVCRDLKSGKQVWINPDADLQAAFKTPELKVIGQLLVSLPVLSVYDDVLMFRAKWVKDTYSLSRKDGTILWKNTTPGGSYRGLTACAVGSVWVGGRTPLDMLTGTVTNGPKFIASGCGPTTSTPDYLISCFGKVAEIKSNKIIRNEDIKSPCDVGTIVSEGIMLTVPSECGCYYEVKGYRALASAGTITPNTAPDWKTRLTVLDTKAPMPLAVSAADWPTYRHDPSRSAASPVVVGTATNVLWHWKPLAVKAFTNTYAFAQGPYLKPDYLATAPVAAADRVWFASHDGMVRCLDALTGKERWNFATGGKVFAAPTIAEGRVLVGGGDGRVYCLDAETGRCLWQFLAAPVDRRVFWFGHLVSSWPVVPGVVVQDGVVYTVAGYQRDNGIHAYALDVKDGRVIWEKDNASLGVNGFWEGLANLGNIALGNGKMWVCGVPAGYFDLKTGDWKRSGGGKYGGEIGMMDKWVFHGGRRLSETQDTLLSPLGGTSFGVTSDEEKPKNLTLIDPGTSLPAWDADLTVMPPKGLMGSLTGIPSAKLLAKLSEGTVAQAAFNWPQLKSWATENVMPASFVLARDQVVVAGSNGRTHGISGYSRFDGARVWTADLPEQPAMNRMALDRDGRVLVALCDGSVLCFASRGPYVDKTVVTRDKVTFVFERAEGGLSLKDSKDGSIQGLTIRDASGVSSPPKAKIDGTSLIVNIKGARFPLKISYTGTGNLGAKGESAAAFEWKTLGLKFEQCRDKVITLESDGLVDGDIWKAEKSYAISGATITKVEVDTIGGSIRLTTDKSWAIGDKATIQYPAHPSDLPGVTAELAFTAMPGRLVTESLLGEFLVGEVQEKIDLAKALELDPLDKNTRPAVGEKWKLCRDPGGMFDLNRHVGPLGHVLAHASVSVYSDADRKVQLWAGSDDGLQVVVNGRVVHTHQVLRGCTPDQDRIKDVELKKGWNTVVMGISQGGGGWGFCLRIKNEQGAGPPAGLRYMAEAPVEEGNADNPAPPPAVDNAP